MELTTIEAPTIDVPAMDAPVIVLPMLEPATIACNARTLRGGFCGEPAVIGKRNVFYHTPKAHRVVRETHLHVTCPKCGRRVQVVTAGAR